MIEQMNSSVQIKMNLAWTFSELHLETGLEVSRFINLSDAKYIREIDEISLVHVLAVSTKMV